MMVRCGWHSTSDHDVDRRVLIVGGVIGAAQGYWVAYLKMPSFIVTLAGMLVFRG